MKKTRKNVSIIALAILSAGVISCGDKSKVDKEAREAEEWEMSHEYLLDEYNQQQEQNRIEELEQEVQRLKEEKQQAKASRGKNVCENCGGDICPKCKGDGGYLDAFGEWHKCTDHSKNKCHSCYQNWINSVFL